MSDLKMEPMKHVGLRLSESMMTTIRKSRQSTSDWLRQAAQIRIDQERGKEPALGKLEKQVDGLQKEIARLQQSEAVAHATVVEMRKTLVAIQQNHVELHRSLEQMHTGFGHAFTALGQSLLVALSQQLDLHLQRVLEQKKDEPPPFKLPPIPPRTRL